jgi:hypothetical protein
VFALLFVCLTLRIAKEVIGSILICFALSAPRDLRNLVPKMPVLACAAPPPPKQGIIKLNPALALEQGCLNTGLPQSASRPLGVAA